MSRHVITSKRHWNYFFETASSEEIGRRVHGGIFVTQVEVAAKLIEENRSEIERKWNEHFGSEIEALAIDVSFTEDALLQWGATKCIHQ